MRYYKNLHTLFMLAVLFWTGCTSSSEKEQAQQLENEETTQEQAYTGNPVLPGDYADPSVVRVGSDYWATATSSEWAPLFPILHSTDLVNWETVGHVFPENLPAWAEAHFWAPEIAYEKGKYYIYYTAKKKGGNLCVGVASATSATGPYTDHGPLVCQEVGSIDGFEIRDEKGDLYLVWKEDGNSRQLPTPLWAQRMNEARTALTGEKFELFRNNPNTWEGGLVEGPALVRRGNYFYTFYAGDACCGRGCTYGVGVARAKSLRGPWEKHPDNPIMQKNDTWRCPGHGTLVTDEQGRDYFLYHAYHNDDFVYVGRQGLLDEVKWDSSTNWPYFENRSPGTTGRAPGTSAGANLDTDEEFTSGTLGQEWQWSVEQKPEYTIRTGQNGQLALTASPEKIGTAIARRTKTGDYAATTAIDVASLPKGTTAGLAAIGDPDNAVGVAIRDKEVVVWQVKGGTMSTIDQTPAPEAGTIQLRLTANDGDKMRFAWSTDGTQWNELNGGNAVDAAYLPPWDRGVRVGLTAKGPAAATAVFDWFRLKHE
ncbi:family 43 glycosylhydrolase [Botryobacter ruber]|uniref:family 43 glycosylhydrolase n=1 Tax=Botryobacter ruber TaxID=2171629 RepID=UPI001F0C1AD8|nr:family 43 glycosylhydrolase [Botryobacter ruber]